MTLKFIFERTVQEARGVCCCVVLVLLLSGCGGVKYQNVILRSVNAFVMEYLLGLFYYFPSPPHPTPFPLMLGVVCYDFTCELPNH